MAIQVSGNAVIDNNRVFFPLNTADKQTTASISAGTLTLDLNSASVFVTTLDQNTPFLTLNNTQASGLTSSFVLVLVGNGTAYTLSWPAAFKWPSGTAPTITSTNGKKDVFVFFTYDGGTSWHAFTSGQNL
jgi:hypothetical protein